MPKPVVLIWFPERCSFALLFCHDVISQFLCLREIFCWNQHRLFHSEYVSASLENA